MGTDVAGDAGKMYQVVGAAALLTQESPTGPVRMHLYRGAYVGPGARPQEIAHNLDVGLIAEVPSGVPLDAGADGTAMAGGGHAFSEGAAGDAEVPVSPVADDEGGAETPPDDGSDGTDQSAVPRKAGRPSAAEKAALVEQAVRVGMDRGEAEKASVTDLRAALKA